MSDKPLFQDADDKEAIYAPQQLPEGSGAERAADLDEQERGGSGPNIAVVPGAALGSGAAGVGTGTGNGMLPGIVPVTDEPRTGNDSGENEEPTAAQQP
jgi:hypothetical protein